MYGIAVNDSTAWLRMSSPLDAATCRRHRPRVVGIEQPERRLEPPARDAGLRVQLGEIEDADAGRLAAGPGRRRNRDQRLERAGTGIALPIGALT